MAGRALPCLIWSDRWGHLGGAGRPLGGRPPRRAAAEAIAGATTHDICRAVSGSRLMRHGAGKPRPASRRPGPIFRDEQNKHGLPLDRDNDVYSSERGGDVRRPFDAVLVHRRKASTSPDPKEEASGRQKGTAYRFQIPRPRCGSWSPILPERWDTRWLSDGGRCCAFIAGEREGVGKSDPPHPAECGREGHRENEKKKNKKTRKSALRPPDARERVL